MIDRETADSLLEAARRARQQAHAPYSGFRVGAALLDSDGGIHPGANVENASYGLTTCAERSAVVGAVSRGPRQFRAVAIVGSPEEDPCLPCGSCRQILYEFGPDMAVVLASGGGEARIASLRDLLPEAFGPESLGSPTERPDGLA